MTTETTVDFQGVSLPLEAIDGEVAKMNRDLDSTSSRSAELRKAIAERIAEEDDPQVLLRLIQQLVDLYEIELNAGPEGDVIV